MPHQQPRTKAAKSPFDLNGVLDAVSRFNLLGITGSNVEFNGQVGLMADEDDIPLIVEALRAAEYVDARAYGEPDGLHLDYVIDEPKGLLAALVRARAHHDRGVVSDVCVGVRPVPFVVDGNGDVIRDSEGYPVDDDPNGRRIDALPVQVYFLVTPLRDTEGNPTAG